jgi:hypothetical protein
VLDAQGSLFVISIFRDMRLLSKFLWLLAFLAATFCWMVLFEHGFSMKGFSHGVREEWQSLTELVSPKAGQPAPDPSVNPPKSK